MRRNRFPPYRALLLSTVFALSGCTLGHYAIHEKEFMEEYKVSHSLVDAKTPSFDDFRIQIPTLGEITYNYKAGEFYSFKQFNLIVVVPINIGHYYFKEDGRFYHIEVHTSGDPTKREIDETTFNLKLKEGRESMISRLARAYQELDGLFAGSQDRYQGIDLRYTRSFDRSKVFLNGTATEISSSGESKVETAHTYALTIQSGLPVHYENKSDNGTDSFDIAYGNAELTLPELERARS